MEKENNKRKIWKIIGAALSVAAALSIVVFAAYMLWEEAPAVEPSAPEVSAAVPENAHADNTAQLLSAKRRADTYTILLVGNDDGAGNTDTIIVGKIDTAEHKMDFVSIPRDTFINIDWNIRKINAVYWGAVNSGGVGIDALKEQIKALTGFDVDCYAVIDLEVFAEAIDLMGGVYFDVPCDMYYTDSAQGLLIDIPAGYQLLDGEQAMGVVRFRSGYENGDLDRVETQQDFLKALAGQFISLGNIPNISELVKLLAENTDTDLDAANIAFFLRQALMCSSEDINFHTMPNSPDFVRGLSYTFVRLPEWLEMVNSCLNPYAEPVTENNVSIVYKEGNTVKCTGKLKGKWYFDGYTPN